MKLAQGLGLAGTLSIFSIGLWLGCSNSTTGTTGDDGGTPPATDSGSGNGGNNDSGSGNGGNNDSGSGNGGNNDSGSGGDAGVTLTCDNYCTTIMNNCQGDNQQYQNKTECLNACQYWPVGTETDAANTLGCHTYHAGKAATGPNPHCWHAGPYGSGVCGASCEDFCLLALDWCSPDAGFTGTPPYASLADCTTACGNFTVAPTDAGADGSAAPPAAYTSAGPGSGDTLDCREYHLGFALTGGANQQTHCPHPAADSGVCHP